MLIEVLDERCKPYLGSTRAAGIDLRARCLGDVAPASLLPGTKYIFGLGIKTNIPVGWVGLVTPRSGQGFNYEVTLANTMGVIDSDYEGEWKAAVVVRGPTPMPFKEFDRICQLVVVPHYDYEGIVYDKILTGSERGSSGLGSSGVE